LLQGTVKWFDNDKGIGYITRDDGGDVSVARGAILLQPPELRTGQRVQFDVLEGRTGAVASTVGEIGSTPVVGRTETPPPLGKLQGTVKWFDAAKKFGLITMDDGGDAAVVTGSIVTQPAELRAGQRVRFDKEDGRNGAVALNVSVISSTPAPPAVEVGPAQPVVNWMAAPLPGQGHGDHFYTTSIAERGSAAGVNGYRAEGVACYVFDSRKAATTALYRLFHSASGDHFYTTSSTERDTAVSVHGYESQGVACYVFNGQQAGTIPLYRLFNDATRDHFYTTSSTERDSAVSVHQYQFESVACYVFENPQTGSTALYRMLRT
jgi:cold shock CspA family protein